VVGIRNGSFTFETASGFQPIYALSASWAATPKLDLHASVSKTVVPPYSLIANQQVTESADLSLDYKLTPKVLLAASVSASYSTEGFGVAPVVSTANPLLRPFTEPVHYYSANASINYSITPFIMANLSYTHTKSVQANFATPDDVVLLALTFSPH
jgi:hypothetical protein